MKNQRGELKHLLILWILKFCLLFLLKVVAPAVRKPSVMATTSAKPTVIQPVSTFPDGMELSLQMIAEGADEILRQVERENFL